MHFHNLHSKPELPNAPLRWCATCHDMFCTTCSVTNYDLREDRHYCLDCVHADCSTTVEVRCCCQVSNSERGVYSNRGCLAPPCRPTRRSFGVRAVPLSLAARLRRRRLVGGLL